MCLPVASVARDQSLDSLTASSHPQSPYLMQVPLSLANTREAGTTVRLVAFLWPQRLVSVIISLIPISLPQHSKRAPPVALLTSLCAHQPSDANITGIHTRAKQQHHHLRRHRHQKDHPIDWSTCRASCTGRRGDPFSDTLS